MSQSTLRKPRTWADGYFPDERILNIALHQNSFMVNYYNKREKSRGKRAKRLVNQGFLVKSERDKQFGFFHITELGKERLKELRNERLAGEKNNEII